METAGNDTIFAPCGERDRPICCRNGSAILRRQTCRRARSRHAVVIQWPFSLCVFSMAKSSNSEKSDISVPFPFQHFYCCVCVHWLFLPCLLAAMSRVCWPWAAPAARLTRSRSMPAVICWIRLAISPARPRQGAWSGFPRKFDIGFAPKFVQSTGCEYSAVPVPPIGANSRDAGRGCAGKPIYRWRQHSILVVRRRAVDEAPGLAWVPDATQVFSRPYEWEQMKRHAPSFSPGVLVMGTRELGVLAFR